MRIPEVSGWGCCWQATQCSENSASAAGGWKNKTKERVPLIGTMHGQTFLIPCCNIYTDIFEHITNITVSDISHCVVHRRAFVWTVWQRSWSVNVTLTVAAGYNVTKKETWRRMATVVHPVGQANSVGRTPSVPAEAAVTACLFLLVPAEQASK